MSGSDQTAQRAADGSGVSHDDWDVSTAEALTRAYETGEAGDMPSIYFEDPPAGVPASQHAAAPSPVAPPRPTMPSAPSVLQPLAFATASAPRALAVAHAAPADRTEEVLAALAGSRDWLDERLADIAYRVEQSLALMKPDTSVAALTQRFDDLEQRFMTAIDGVSRKADLAGLQQVETHLAELTRHLETNQTQVQRLDGIEDKLGVLAEIARAQIEAAEAAPGPAALSLAGGMAGLPDLAALAHDAAVHAAERVSRQPPAAPSPDPRIDGIQQQLQEFIDERRREDGHTTSMLDTMQEALVRLIDRLDLLDPAMQQPGTLAIDPRDQLPLAAAAPVAPAAPTAAAAIKPAIPASAPKLDTGVVYVEDERGQTPGRRSVDHIGAIDVTEKVARAQAAQAAQAKAATAARPKIELGPETDIDALVPDVAAVAAEVADAPAPVKPAARIVEPRPQPASASQPKSVPPRTGRQVPQTTIAMPDETEPKSVARKGIVVAGYAALCIIVGGFGLSFMGNKLRSSMVAQPKLDERVPALKQAVPTADPAAKPTPVNLDAAPADQRLQRLPESAPPPPRQRSIPETVTEDLSQNAEPRRTTLGPVPSLAAAGISLQPATISPVDLARQLQVKTIAPPLAPPAAAPAPTAAAAPARPLTTASIKPQEPAADALPITGLADMPPATIGPVSLRHAAQKGDPAAQFEIAARFAEGKGVKQDFKQATEWYQRSAQQGFVPSQYRLGTIFERGLTGSADVERASLWYQRAAEQGNVKAMHNLAVLSAGRDGTPADYKAASRWFREAADRGLADSQFNLAVLYENGLGVTPDKIQSYKWFAIAARSGDKEAIKRRDQLAARFDPDELRGADQAVSSWRSRPLDLKANDPRAAGDALRAKAEQMAEQQQLEQQPPAQPPIAVGQLPAIPTPDPSAAKVRVHKGTPATPPVIR